MKYLQILVLLLSYFFILVIGGVLDAEHFMHTEYERVKSETCRRVTTARVEYLLDLMNFTKKEIFKYELRNSMKVDTKLQKKLLKFDLRDIIKDDVKHEIDIALSARMPSEEYIRSKVNILADVTQFYNLAKICPWYDQHCDMNEKGMRLYEVEREMQNSTNYNHLLYLWTEWRNTIGRRLKSSWRQNAVLENNNHPTTDHEFRSLKEKQERALKLWSDIEPFYMELHKYVARKLKKHYGDQMDISDGLIPAHLLGDMWAQNWYHIEPLVRPFPNASDGNLEENMKQNLSVIDMYSMADHFFQFLGFKPMWEAYEGPDQMIYRPRGGKEVHCLPTSHDYCNGSAQITFCTRVNFQDYIEIYQQMGYVQYFHQYAHLPFLYRKGASPEFPEAIGGTIGLAATSPGHLIRQGLLTHYIHSYESSINYLMKIALIKVAFLPSALIDNQWKLRARNGDQLKDINTWNRYWWKLKKKYQRIKPPIERSAEEDFDAASNYNVLMNHPSIHKFFARIMEFQIYRSFCLDSQNYYTPVDEICPLHFCNFYNRRYLGQKLEAAMSLGAKLEGPGLLHWLSGSNEISAEPLLQYFQPLYDYLKEENKLHDAHDQITFIVMGVTIIILIITLALTYYKRRVEGRESPERTNPENGDRPPALAEQPPRYEGDPMQLQLVLWQPAPVQEDANPRWNNPMERYLRQLDPRLVERLVSWLITIGLSRQLEAQRADQLPRHEEAVQEEREAAVVILVPVKEDASPSWFIAIDLSLRRLEAQMIEQLARYEEWGRGAGAVILAPVRQDSIPRSLTSMELQELQRTLEEAAMLPAPARQEALLRLFNSIARPLRQLNASAAEGPARCEEVEQEEREAPAERSAPVRQDSSPSSPPASELHPRTAEPPATNQEDTVDLQVEQEEQGEAAPDIAPDIPDAERQDSSPSSPPASELHPRTAEPPATNQEDTVDLQVEQEEQGEAAPDIAPDIPDAERQDSSPSSPPASELHPRTAEPPSTNQEDTVDLKVEQDEQGEAAPDIAPDIPDAERQDSSPSLLTSSERPSRQSNAPGAEGPARSEELAQREQEAPAEKSAPVRQESSPSLLTSSERPSRQSNAPGAEGPARSEEPAQREREAPAERSAPVRQESSPSLLTSSERPSRQSNAPGAEGPARSEEPAQREREAPAERSAPVRQESSPSGSSTTQKTPKQSHSRTKKRRTKRRSQERKREREAAHDRSRDLDPCD